MAEMRESVSPSAGQNGQISRSRGKDDERNAINHGKKRSKTQRTPKPLVLTGNEACVQASPSILTLVTRSMPCAI